MWHIKFSKRDFLEFWLGGGRKIPSPTSRVQSTGSVEVDDAIRAFWSEEPSVASPFPHCIVASEAQLASLLTAINASPATASPVSAFSRLISTKDFNEYSRSAPMDFSGQLNPAIVALAMAEAAWLSDGKVGLRQISFAACKRTLSYAFGRALSVQVSGEGLERLPARWLDVYLILNPTVSPHQMRETLTGLTSALSAFAAITWGLSPSNQATELAFAIHNGDRQALRAFWTQFSSTFAPGVDLDALQASTRESRANYLQAALGVLSNNGNEMAVAVCAFIATQIAPGSLEHLELLRQSGKPALVFWYALFAALQAPSDILSAQAGLGFKIYRGITTKEDLLSAPSADISYEEIKIFERTGIEGFIKNFGHQNEVVVELVPAISSSFSYGARQVRGNRQDPSLTSQFEASQSEIKRLGAAYKSKVDQAVSVLAQLSRELSELDEPYKRGSRRKS